MFCQFYKGENFYDFLFAFLHTKLDPSVNVSVWKEIRTYSCFHFQVDSFLKWRQNHFDSSSCPRSAPVNLLPGSISIKMMMLYCLCTSSIPFLMARPAQLYLSTLWRNKNDDSYAPSQMFAFDPKSFFVMARFLWLCQANCVFEPVHYAHIRSSCACAKSHPIDTSAQCDLGPRCPHMTRGHIFACWDSHKNTLVLRRKTLFPFEHTEALPAQGMSVFSYSDQISRQHAHRFHDCQQIRWFDFSAKKKPSDLDLHCMCIYINNLDQVISLAEILKTVWHLKLLAVRK